MAVLPLAPPPLPGELLASWIGRLACLYDAPPEGLWYELAGASAVELAPFGHHQPGGNGFREQFGGSLSRHARRWAPWRQRR